MKLLRVKTEHKHNYTVVDNDFIKNDKLSLQAKGFLLFIFSLPEDWDFSVEGICTITKEKKAAIWNILKELTSEGYCKKETIRSKFKIEGVQYTFYENSSFLISEKQTCEMEVIENELHTDYQCTDYQSTDNRPQLNKEELNKKEINKNVDVDNINNINYNSKNAPQPHLSDVELKKTVHY